MSEKFKNILDRVSDIFRKQGIKKITMEDVCHELGISKKTLYRYVKDKSDLIRKVLVIEMKRVEQGFEMIKEKHENAIMELVQMNLYVRNMIKNYKPSIVNELKSHYPEHYLFFIRNRRASMYEWIKENIVKGKREGLFRNDLDEDVIAKIYVSRVEGLEDDIMGMRKEIGSKQFYTEMLIYHIRGISNEAGIKVFEKNSNKLKI